MWRARCPSELNRQGADVRVVLPKYRCIDWYWRERMTHVTDFPVLFGLWAACIAAWRRSWTTA